MNNIDKVILLSESLGADVSNFTSSYVEAVIKSDAFKNLTENVSWATQFKMKKSNLLVYDYKSINFYAKNFAESVTLASRINYLSSISDECYYLNPLCFNGVKVKTSSIGDLMTMYDGKPRSFNEIILDDSHQLKYKADVITRQVEYYRQEAIEVYKNPLSKTESNSGVRSLVRKGYLSLVIYGLFALIAVALMGLILFSKHPTLRDSLVNIDFKNLYMYGLYGVLGSGALVVFFYTLLLARTTVFFQPYYYYKKFYKRKLAKLTSEINYRAQLLAEYIFQACQNKKALEKDIYKFSKIKASRIDLDSYKKMYGYKKAKGLKALRKLLMIFIVILFVSVIYLVIVYLLKKFVLK